MGEEFSYRDKLYDIEYDFQPSNKQLMITFDPKNIDKVYGIEDEGIVFINGANDIVGFARLHVQPKHSIEQAIEFLEKKKQQKIINEYVQAMVPTSSKGDTQYFLPKRFLIQLKNKDPSFADLFFSKEGLKTITKHSTPGFYAVEVPGNSTLFATLRKYNGRDQQEVKFASPDQCGFYEMLWSPNDNYWTTKCLWGLRNLGSSNGCSLTDATSGADVNARSAWNIIWTGGLPAVDTSQARADCVLGDAEVIVATVDTGIDLDHADLFVGGGADNRIESADDHSGSGTADDTSGHGTAVAGVAVAFANTSLISTKKVIGVAPGCRVASHKANLAAGQYSERVNAINHVKDDAFTNSNTRRYVLHLGWKCNDDTGIHNAIDDAISENVLVVAAAGNSNANIDLDPVYPAAWPNVVPVGATNLKDERWSVSATQGSSQGANVVYAPGVQIYTTSYNNTYAIMTGTSMSSAFVAGIAALVWSLDRHATKKNGAWDLNNAGVRDVIMAATSCDPLVVPPGGAASAGIGRIDAYLSLTHATII